jgi:hypothetical protein
MSDSDRSSNLDSEDDLSESWLDDIASCQLDLEKIVQETNTMLINIDSIQRKIDGPRITIEGKTKSISNWITEWEDEMTHDTVHHITWGQFIIEKLAKCNEC